MQSCHHFILLPPFFCLPNSWLKPRPRIRLTLAVDLVRWFFDDAFEVIGRNWG